MMDSRSWKRAGVAALFAFAAACSDDNGLGPNGSLDLTADEAALVAESQADLMDGILDGEIEARPLIVSGSEASGLQPAFSMVPVTTEFEFSRSRPCRNGGQILAEGSGVHVADRETGVVTIDFSGDKTIDNCARARGDVVITINGGGTFQGHRMKVHGRYEGLQTNDQEGRFEWESSDGRSGECGYEIHVVWDPATHSKTITGFVCDRQIGRSVMRDGAAGNDAPADA
jgi:hypothetical protein